MVGARDGAAGIWSTAFAGSTTAKQAVRLRGIACGNRTGDCRRRSEPASGVYHHAAKLPAPVVRGFTRVVVDSYSRLLDRYQRHSVGPCRNLCRAWSECHSVAEMAVEGEHL